MSAVEVELDRDAVAPAAASDTHHDPITARDRCSGPGETAELAGGAVWADTAGGSVGLARGGAASVQVARPCWLHCVAAGIPTLASLGCLRAVFSGVCGARTPGAAG